jgi:hypothetical protein
MKTHERKELKLHGFLTSTLNVGEWLASCCSHFISGKTPWYALDQGWVDSRAGMDAVAKRKICLLAENQTLVIQRIAKHFTD